MTTRIPHPGDELRDVLAPLHLKDADVAAAIGVSRKTVSAILNGRARITTGISIRLGRALDVPPDFWARKQFDYDMATTSIGRIRVRRLVPSVVPSHEEHTV